MKKNLVKSVAVAVALACSMTVLPAATTSVSAAIGQGYPYDAGNVNYSTLTGSTVVTKDNLPEKAKELYNSKVVEGETVLKIINTANYYAENYYALDGKAKGNKDAYKNAFVGACLSMYFPDSSNEWLNALYNQNSFLESLDYYNTQVGMGEFKYNKVYNYSMIMEFANNLVEDGLCITSGLGEGQYTTSWSTKSGRKLTNKQAQISSKNYAFATGTVEDYAKAYDEFHLYSHYELRFNNVNDAMVKTYYGALIYLRSQNTNLSEEDAKAWMDETFDVGGTTKIGVAYKQNALRGFEAAKGKGITTEEEAKQLAKELETQKRLLAVDKDNGLYAVEKR